MNEPDFERRASEYLWGDYVNAKDEHEEVATLAALLKEMYESGRGVASHGQEE